MPIFSQQTNDLIERLFPRCLAGECIYVQVKHEITGKGPGRLHVTDTVCTFHQTMRCRTNCTGRFPRRTLQLIKMPEAKGESVQVIYVV